MKAERYFFDELVASNQGSSAANENAFTYLDMDRMAREWNDRVEEERCKGKAIYPKTAGLLKSFFTKRAERNNRKRALAVDVGGVAVSDRIKTIRCSFQQQDQSYLFDPVQAEPAPIARDTSKPSAGSVSRVPVPPVQVQVNGSEEVRRLVQKEAHLERAQPPPPPRQPARRRNPMRCMRCGKKKDGSFHKSNAASNSEEYCKVATADRTPYWRVPPGYHVGDACKKEAQRKIVQEWKRICRERGYNDESWAFWGNY